MKRLITTILLVAFGMVTANAQIAKSKISTKSSSIKNVQVNQGVKIPNIDKLRSTDLERLKIPTVSITDAQKNGKVISSWEISPLRPKNSSLSIDSYYGEYSLTGWQLEPRPGFEGPEFKGFFMSSILLNFRVSRGSRYIIRVQLQETRNDWYEGKTILAAAIHGSFAQYPIDSYNNEVLIPFTANSSGIKRISIGNIINSNSRLFAYTIKKININKI